MSKFKTVFRASMGFFYNGSTGRIDFVPGISFAPLEPFYLNVQIRPEMPLLNSKLSCFAQLNLNYPQLGVSTTLFSKEIPQAHNSVILPIQHEPRVDMMVDVPNRIFGVQTTFYEGEYVWEPSLPQEEEPVRREIVLIPTDNKLNSYQPRSFWTWSGTFVAAFLLFAWLRRRQ